MTRSLRHPARLGIFGDGCRPVNSFLMAAQHTSRLCNEGKGFRVNDLRRLRVNARVACDLRLLVSAKVPQGYAVVFQEAVCGAITRALWISLLPALSAKENPAHTLTKWISLVPAELQMQHTVLNDTRGS
jgi:hypothetical protein